MGKKEWFIINNIEDFVQSTRVLVYSAFGSKDNKQGENFTIDISALDELEISELNNCLSQNESLLIAKEYLKISKKEKDNYIISDSKYAELIEALNTRMVSNMLVKLTQDGVLESAFDEESNDFIFWVKDDEKNKEKNNDSEY